MKHFQPEMRIRFEQQARAGLEADIVNEITKLDEKAAKLRKEGKKPRKELESEVEALAGRVSMGYANQRAAIDQHLEEQRAEYEQQRDRQPERELAAIERSKLRIDALDNSEVNNLSNAFASGQAELSLEEARRLAARGDSNVKSLVNSAISEQLLDRPWIKDNAENLELYSLKNQTSQIEQGNIFVEGTGIHVEHLIDFDDELNSPIK